MEQRIDCLGLLLIIYFSYVTSLLTHCEARKPLNHVRAPQAEALKQHLATYYSTSDPNSNYLGSPYYIPPFDDVLGPSSSPQENPPYCIYPPLAPLPPSTAIPSPILPIQSPPPPSASTSPTTPSKSPPSPSISTSPPIFTPNAPEFSTPGPPGFEAGPPSYEPSPPEFEPSPPCFEPSPPEYVPSPPELSPGPPIFLPPTAPSKSPPSPPISTSPPIFTPNTPEFPTPGPPGPPSYGPSPPEFEPSPSCFEPSPPKYVPSPLELSPGPPIFLPPIVYPPLAAPPPQHAGIGPGLWCVAKPTVPDLIIQEAMNYACGSGANCDAIQPNGACYQPDTLLAHASFAFNSYWQRTKVAGGTCDFGGTAILITKDPSYDGCRFNIN